MSVIGERVVPTLEAAGGEKSARVPPPLPWPTSPVRSTPTQNQANSPAPEGRRNHPQSPRCRHSPSPTPPATPAGFLLIKIFGDPEDGRAGCRGRASCSALFSAPAEAPKAINSGGLRAGDQVVRGRGSPDTIQSGLRRYLGDECLSGRRPARAHSLIFRGNPEDLIFVDD